jgi:cardiolipin synthase (CMP-forming)
VFPNVPNLITILRILLVPLTVWLMISHSFAWALAAFIVAGVSDGVDGYIARKFDLRSELGANLDPLADKALLMSIFVVLGALQVIPVWLVILVVTRDVLIIGAVMLSWFMGRPVAVKPLLVSKANTTVQIVFAGVMLTMLSTQMHFEVVMLAGIAAVAFLTVASGALYMRDWMRHMAGKGTA